MQNLERIILIIILIVLISILILIFILMVLSILNFINKLKEYMVKILKLGNLEEYKIIDYKNEIIEMVKNYNELIKKLKDEFWINDNRNFLNE